MTPLTPAAVTALTPEQEHILRHMLGIDDPAKNNPKPYRDYYCANPDERDLHELARLGLIRMYSAHGGYEWFTTTDTGKAAAFASQKRIRYPKKRRVYLAFLHISDCCADLTFREFLTSPDFADARRDA